MTTIPVKTKERITTGIKKFIPILRKALAQDVNESDTVTIISDMLSDIFGYAKYSEITSEFAIRKTYCDLAIKIDDTVKMLIECKAVGVDLKEQHVKQAVDYGANAGIDWVILTNGVAWKVYRILFSKPIFAELLYEFDFTSISPKKQADLDLLYYLSREAMKESGRSSLEKYRNQKQVVNRFVLAQILVSDTGIMALKRLFHKLSPEIKVSDEDVRKILIEEIIKRDVLEDEKATEAKKRVNKAFSASPKPNKKKDDTPDIPDESEESEESEESI